jgi:hypothetical protein
MSELIKFVAANKTIISLGGLWAFSALCSAMPPLPEKAGYGLTWAHNFLQAVAANINKIKH